jgi:hypothetical protein
MPRPQTCGREIASIAQTPDVRETTTSQRAHCSRKSPAHCSRSSKLPIRATPYAQQQPHIHPLATPNPRLTSPLPLVAYSSVPITSPAS